MRTALCRSCFIAAAILTCCSPLVASIVTSNGPVTALTNVSQLLGVVGTASFDEGETAGAIPLGTYTPKGMTFRTGALSSILPSVTTPGTASQPFYEQDSTYSYELFPATISGGGTHAGQFAYAGAIATFSTTVTQFGLTASKNGNQFLTAWNKNGTLLGQVNWVPQNDSGFIGIDTGGVPIGMIAFGNDDLWNKETYDIAGPTIMFDTMQWASGHRTSRDPRTNQPHRLGTSDHPDSKTHPPPG